MGDDRQVELLARTLCETDGRDPDNEPPEGGYWSYAIGGRAGEGHQAPKQWISTKGPPQWKRYESQARQFLIRPPGQFVS